MSSAATAIERYSDLETDTAPRPAVLPFPPTTPLAVIETVVDRVVLRHAARMARSRQGSVSASC